MAIPPLPPPPGGQSGAASSSPSPEPRRKRRWALVVTGVMVVAMLMAATAAITYAFTRTDAGAPLKGTPSAAESTPTSTVPTYSEAEQEKAKQQVCDVFSASVLHQGRKGPLVDENGTPNLPVVVRKLGSVVAVKDALTPVIPHDVTAAARRYIDVQLDLVTATMAYEAPDPIDEVARLTTAANDATYALADLCEVPH